MRKVIGIKFYSSVISTGPKNKLWNILHSPKIVNYITRKEKLKSRSVKFVDPKWKRNFSVLSRHSMKNTSLQSHAFTKTASVHLITEVLLKWLIAHEWTYKWEFISLAVISQNHRIFTFSKLNSIAVPHNYNL